MSRFVNRALGLVLAAAGLALAAPAVAQTAIQQSNQAAKERGVEPIREGGLVQGTVQDVDFAKGLITIRSTTGLITLRSVPTQLMGYKKGDNVALAYRGSRYHWLWEQIGFAVGRPGGVGQAAPFAMQGTLVGTVGEINLATGEVLVDGPTGHVLLHGHPALLHGLVPGSYARFFIGDIAGAHWVGRVEPAFESAVGGSGQTRAADESEK